jgi:hypothetical protein
VLELEGQALVLVALDAGLDVLLDGGSSRGPRRPL